MKDDIKYCSMDKENLQDYVYLTTPGKINMVALRIFEQYWENKTKEKANLTKIYEIKLFQ